MYRRCHKKLVLQWCNLREKNADGKEFLEKAIKLRKLTR